MTEFSFQTHQSVYTIRSEQLSFRRIYDCTNLWCKTGWENFFGKYQNFKTQNNMVSFNFNEFWIQKPQSKQFNEKLLQH